MESNVWRERAVGFIGGSLILVFVAFVYGQYQFQAHQRVLFLGTIDGEWNDTVPVKKGK